MSPVPVGTRMGKDCVARYEGCTGRATKAKSPYCDVCREKRRREIVRAASKGYRDKRREEKLQRECAYEGGGEGGCKEKVRSVHTMYCCEEHAYLAHLERQRQHRERSRRVERKYDQLVRALAELRRELGGGGAGGAGVGGLEEWVEQRLRPWVLMRAQAEAQVRRLKSG